jgi:hypothetical protein
MGQWVMGRNEGTTIHYLLGSASIRFLNEQFACEASLEIQPAKLGVSLSEDVKNSLSGPQTQESLAKFQTSGTHKTSIDEREIDCCLLFWTSFGGCYNLLFE